MAVFTVLYFSFEHFMGAGRIMPDEIKVPRSIINALIWNVPLLLALLEWRAPWRYFLAVILFCTGSITTFAMLNFNLIVVAWVGVIHCGFILKLLFARNYVFQIPVPSER